MLEPFARELLARDPASGRSSRTGSATRSSRRYPKARLEFFDRRHPVYDGAYRVYPVLRVDVAP